MVAWLLHRISGIGIVVFVSMHIISAFFVNSVEGTGASVAQALLTFYESLPMQVFVLFAVLFHAVNGLRIVILDMWPSLLHYNREALWVQWALFLPMFFLPATLMILGVQF
jgi:succinate dehydrogenase / fumarate reductase cytochrome b subunit